MTPLPLLTLNFKISIYINIFFFFLRYLIIKKYRPIFPNPSTTTAICRYAVWTETDIRIFFLMWSLVVGVDIYILLSTYDFLIQLVSGFTTLGTISWDKLVKRKYFFSLFSLMINFCFVSLLLYLCGSKLKKKHPFCLFLYETKSYYFSKLVFCWSSLMPFLRIIKNNSDFIRI